MGTTEAGKPDGTAAKRFGTFGGVFTPSILTILGVIMYMRTGFVIGLAGIRDALLILLIAKSITFLTTFSISAIATNTKVKGGGAYFLISRSLGPEFGGTIGLALFLAQTLSVPFYILGFTEALITTFPAVGPYFAPIIFATAIVLFIVVVLGADWAIKVQYVIMTVLLVSIATFLAGAHQSFDMTVLKANWENTYGGTPHSFWSVFAIFFPAVTGIMAGVNMSGDLKNPARSIPWGTLAAVAVGGAVYAAQIVLCGGSTERAALVADPYRALMDNAWRGLWLFVALGVFCATLSSALGSLLGAPRILQSLARDKLLAPLRPFAALSRSGEPRRALMLTLLLTLAVLYWARNSAGGGALNVVAALVSMLFLWTYGITNIAAFVESFGGNPSFRPRFRLFHWSLALLGAAGCVFAAFLIDPLAALLAVVLIALIFAYVKKFVLAASFGDARRGFYYSRTRTNLLRLAKMPVHPKNWRPTIMVLSGNPNSRLALVKYADWLGSGRGIVTLAGLIQGDPRDLAPAMQKRAEALEVLASFIDENGLQAFPEVLVTPELGLGLSQLVQCNSLGPLKANLAMFGWPQNPERAAGFAEHLRIARAVGMSLILVKGTDIPTARPRKRRIDIWWRGKQNGSLMVILAHLVSLNADWSGCTIRILRLVDGPEHKDVAREELTTLVEAARMSAEIEVIHSAKPFAAILHESSIGSTVVVMGFQIPEGHRAADWQRFYTGLTADMPTTLLVSSTGEADLLS